MGKWKWKRTGVLIAVATACGLPAACKQREHKPKVISLKGIVEKIDRPNNVVTVRFYSEKRQAERVQDVHVTDETEILINGILASLADVKEGERARGSVRVTKSQNGIVFTALRVQINRAEPLKRPPADVEHAGSLTGADATER